MPFAKRHEEILKKITPPSRARMWLNTLVFGALVFAACSLYLFARRGDFNLYIANKALAVDAVILIGLSYALSGLVYFWDFVDTKIIYRKFLGLTGFAIAAAHVAVSVLFLPERSGSESITRESSEILGVLAFLIFAVLAASSNRYAFHELGSKRWRTLQRFGYLGFILLLTHFSILKYGEWIKWFSAFNPVLPPLSLLAIIFGAGVLVIRTALWLSIRKKKRNRN